MKDIETREEGGTPAIVESIRAGLVMKLKKLFGVEYIMEREEMMRRRFIQRFQQNKNIIILGVNKTGQLPIFSFLVQHPQSGLYLHHNFVVSLLNDLFGVQTRGGCACAGPYLQKLLAMSNNVTDK